MNCEYCGRVIVSFDNRDTDTECQRFKDKEGNLVSSCGYIIEPNTKVNMSNPLQIPTDPQPALPADYPLYLQYCEAQQRARLPLANYPQWKQAQAIKEEVQALEKPKKDREAFLRQLFQDFLDHPTDFGMLHHMATECNYYRNEKCQEQGIEMANPVEVHFIGKMSGNEWTPEPLDTPTDDVLQS